MAAGVPVVATNITGTKEVVEDRHTGLLINSECQQKLAKGVEELLASPKLRHDLSETASASVLRFSYDRIMPDVRELYLAALS